MFALLAMLLSFGSPTFAQVAKIGDTGYTTLNAAMTEANKAAGNYTITLLQNSAEVFTFAQKSGVNITVDGDGNTFSGKITLSAGGGNLAFTDAKIAPANSQTIYLNASTAPNVTFDGCTLQGANKSGTIIYGYASATSNKLTVKNCTADNLQYIVSHRQTGANSVLVENVTATNMIYLVRTLKCPSVTVKNVTVSDAVIGIDIKNDAAGGKLTLEDVNINIVTYGGSLYVPVSGSGAGKDWTITTKGENTFSANGVAYEDNSWFSGNAGYTIVDGNPVKVGEKTYATLAKAVAAAQTGETVTLLKDATGAGVVINKNVTIDFGGKTYSFNEGVGSTGTESNGFQILKGTNVVLKNGTLKVAEGAAQKFYILVQNYADNLTVEDMTLDGTFLDKWSKTDQDSYVLSNNSGNVIVKGNTNITANNDGNKAFAFDVCDKTANGYTAPVVNIETTGKIAGKIEVSASIPSNLNIKSGTFTTPLEAAWFETGYSAKDNGDGTFGVAVSAAMIGNNTYAKLADAIKAATAGQTITLLSDLTEDVTINKNLTIDGDGKTYTGNIKATNKVDVVIKNVNFDGKGYNGYAIDMKGAYNITVEKCTVKNYGYGFLQNANGSVSTTVKDVTIKDVNYGVKVDYANSVLLENVKMTNVQFGILNSNYGAKTITIKNSELTTLNIWERNQTTYTTFKFEGKNTVAAFPTSTLVKYEGVIVGNNAYGELKDALAEVKADDVLSIHSNYTLDKSINVTGNLTINGNDKTLTYTGSGASARAITVESTANGANLTVKNLTIDCTASYCQRGLNYNTNGALVLDGVTVKGKNVTYALNLPGSSDNAVVTINGGSYTGNIALNVWGEDAKINATGSHFTSVDNSTAEGYSAIALNNDGTTAAEGAVVNITGGTITAKDENGNPSNAVRNATATGKVNVSDETTVVGNISNPVAIVEYGTDQFYSCATFQAAIDKAIETKGSVKLIADVTASEIITVKAPVVINGNGKKLTSTAGRAINVSGADGVTIKNLTIDAKGERAINVIQNATNVIIDNVTATAANYTVNVAASAPAAVVAIKNSTLNGLCTVNVAAAGTNVTIDNSTVNCNDNNTTAGESYAALCLNKAAVDASIVATNTTVNVTEGSDSEKGRNGAENGTVTINGSTEGVTVTVAVITYPGSDNYHGFTSLADAIEFAKTGDVVTLIRNATGAGVVINKNAVIDFNGKTYTVNEGVGSTGTETLGLQILKGNNVTLKNGTLTSEGDKVKMLINNYTNLTVDNMKLVDATDAIQYVLSNNSGNVVIKNSSEITANGAIALDACKYANYELPVVTVEEGVKVTGDVEVSATLNMNGTLNGSIILNGDNGVVNGAKGLTVNSNVEGYKAVYADGKWTLVAMTFAAKIGEAQYETLAEAIAAAQAGQTIELLANVEGNVTLSKNVTIDGAGKSYTGTMTINNVTATIQNVAFVKGQVYKHKSTGAQAQITIKGCSFDGQGLNAYAVNVGNGVSLAIENVTAKSYGYGFLQVPSSFSSISVKDVEVSSMYYGFKVDYAGAVSMENVTIADDVTIGIYDSNYGDKTYTIKNSEISSISIWERSAAKTTTFTFEGLNKVASFTTSQYAKVVAEAKSSNNYYGDLAAVVEDAAKAATVELCKDVTLKGGNEQDAEAGLVIDKELVLDGKGYTINCGTFVKGIRVYNPIYPNKWRATFQNVTIVNDNANGRCIDTRNGAINLSVLKSSLIATNGNSQPLTIGGSEAINSVTLSDHVTIDAGNSGYAVINFVPAKQFISTAGACEISGYAAFYCKADNTRFNLTNTKITGKNVHSGETNGFGAIVLEGNNNIVNLLSRTDAIAITEGGAEQAAILVCGNNNTITMEEKYSGKTNISAEVKTQGENAYWTMVNAIATGTSIVKYGENVELVAEANGYQFVSFEEAVRFAKNGGEIKLLSDVALDTKTLVTDCDGYSTIINVEDMELTFDLNGYTMTVNAAAANLVDAKSKMLMAVFSVDKGGKLTINDSSEAKTGAVVVNANDAMVYSVVANYTDGAYTTINGGKFIADKVHDSMIYSGAHEALTVNDGNFNLGNLGTPEVQNGKPWIFNVYGANERHLFVNGGTFNADINHQYWAFEVVVPETRALRNNGDGTWTMVDAAAWVNEPWKKYNRAVGYATLEEAIAVDNKFENTVTLAKNVEVENMITVKNGETLVLDLNGKTLAATDNTTKNYSLIDNRGDLTITGKGTMTVKATVNSGWNRYSAVIANNPGGKLTVENGTIEHLGGTDMAYGIDNLTNGKGTYAETIINDGTVKSTYRAVRQFLNGVEAQNILTVNAGTLEGANKSIFFHDPSAKANNGKLYVSEDATLKGDVYLYVTAGSTEWPVEVEIAKVALDDESTVTAANVPEDAAALVEYEEFWQVEQKKIAELTIVDENYAEYINLVEKNVGTLTYVRTFETTNWQTIYLPFEVPVEALEAAGLEAAYIYNASYKGDVATIDHVDMTEGSLAANYPYMIRALEAGEKSVVVENATLTVTNGEYDAIDCSSVFEKFTFTGTYNAVAAEDLVSDNKVKHFVLVDGEYSELEEIGAFRFYLTIEKKIGEFPAKSHDIRMRSVDGSATGVEGIYSNEGSDVIFDLQGRRVLQPQKGGVYIINGKKVVY